MNDFKYLRVANEKDLKLLMMQLIFLGYGWNPSVGIEYMDEIRIKRVGYIIINTQTKNITGYADDHPGEYNITIETTIEDLTEE